MPPPQCARRAGPRVKPARSRTAPLPAPAAPPSFAPALDREAARWVETTLKSLTDAQLVGQLLMGRLDSTYLSADSAKFEELAALVRDIHIGGFCAFGGVELVPAVMLNATYGPTILGQPLELAAILNRLQGLSTLPLLVAADFEHGVGMRISGGTQFPRAMAFGAAGDPALVREAARIAAVEARALGVHVNFAPVADVNNNPRNPVINIRSFGEDPGARGRHGAGRGGGPAERRSRGHAEALPRARRHRRSTPTWGWPPCPTIARGSTASSWRRFAMASRPAQAARWWRTWRCRRSIPCRDRPPSAGRS